MSEFSGKVALITGAGRGIGRAAALALARRGATVVAANRRIADGESLVEEITARGGKAHFVATDVAEPDQVKRLMDEAMSRCGRIDIVFKTPATRSRARCSPTRPKTPSIVCSTPIRSRSGSA